MFRLVSMLMAAILCHSAPAAAEDLAVGPVSDEMLMLAIDIVKAADHHHAIRSCITERCKARSTIKSVGKVSLYFVGIKILRKYVSTAYARSALTSYATKTMAKLGFAAVGVAGVEVIVLIGAAYESTIGAVSTAETGELYEGLLYDDVNRHRFLSLPRESIFAIARRDSVLTDELMLMADRSIVAASRSTSAEYTVD